MAAPAHAPGWQPPSPSNNETQKVEPGRATVAPAPGQERAGRGSPAQAGVQSAQQPPAAPPEQSHGGGEVSGGAQVDKTAGQKSGAETHTHGTKSTLPVYRGRGCTGELVHAAIHVRVGSGRGTIDCWWAAPGGRGHGAPPAQAPGGAPCPPRCKTQPPRNCV